jgi:hypothetical protein
MRNAVIRKKAIKNQNLIRQWIQQPIRVVTGLPTEPIDWAKISKPQRIWAL